MHESAKFTELHFYQSLSLLHARYISNADKSVGISLIFKRHR